MPSCLIGKLAADGTCCLLTDSEGNCQLGTWVVPVAIIAAVGIAYVSGRK